MPQQLVSLKFEELLTTTGLQNLKNQIEQVLSNPQASAEIAFEYLMESGQTTPWRIPVSIQEILNQYEISWTAPGVGQPGDLFDLSGIATQLKELKITIDKAGTAIQELHMELLGEIRAFNDAVTNQAAKIPFRVTVEELNGTKHFRISQITTMPHPQVTMGGLTAILKNSYLTFTASSITALEIEAEVHFPLMLNSSGTSNEPATLLFIHSGNRFIVTATNLPLSNLHGFKARIDSIHLIVENGNIMNGSNASGKLIPDFLDHDTSGPPQIDFAVVFDTGGKVIYQANNPEGHALKKGPVNLSFNNINIETIPGNSPDINITGKFSLDGVNHQDGSPVQTNFDLEYAGGLCKLTGRDFIPVPLGFGIMTLASARLHIETTSGSVTVSEWKGTLQLPLFDQGSLEFEILFDNATNTLTIHVANQNDIPINYGDISLLLKPFSMIYRNGSLDDITGNGILTLPVISGTQPMEVEIAYSKQASNAILIIRVKNFHTPELAGSQLAFNRAEFIFNNGIFSTANIDGRITLPNVTGGNGAGFLMEIDQNGNEILFSLNPVTAPHPFEFGPVILNLSSLKISILNGQLVDFEGAGDMELPSLQDPLSFSFSYDASAVPAQYEFIITGLKTSLGSFEIEILNFNLRSRAGHSFQIDSDGKLWLPVFSGGNGLSYDLTVANNTTYRINTRSGTDTISFGEFRLSEVDIGIDVIGGIVQSYSGNGKIAIPGIPSAIAIQVTYNGQTKIHLIALTAPVKDIPFFGGKIDFNAFSLELLNKNFSQGSAAGKLMLPGTTGSGGLSYSLAVNNQGDYDLNIPGNNERLNLRVLELEIPSPGFSMQIRNGNLHQANGSGILIFPGIVPVSPFSVSFSITGTGNPVVYAWDLKLQDVEASIAGFTLQFDTIEIACDSAGLFSSIINGKAHLPLFSEGIGIAFDVQIPDNTSYKIALDQTQGSVAFGGFELSEVGLMLEVTGSELQNFNGNAQILIPAFTSPVAVKVDYKKQNSGNKKELTVALPAGTPEIPLFGGSVKIDEFELTMLDEEFGSCDGRGVFMLPGAVGSGGVNFLFEMIQADAGKNYRLQLDSSAAQPAVIDFHALKLTFNTFLLQVINSKFHLLDASGNIAISALDNTNLSFSLLVNAPANAGDPLSYIITGSGTAQIGSFSLLLGNITIQCTNNSFSASATGQMMLPVFSDGTLGFSISFGNSGKDYDIVVSENTHELTFGSFGLTVGGLILRVRNDKLDHLAVTDAVLRIPGLQTPLAVNVVYLQNDSQGRESLELELAAPLSAGFGGGNITINDDFKLLILDGSFDSCNATGRFRLPGSTSPAAEGIRFSMQVENAGNRFTLQMSGNPNENVLSFGPVSLEFEAFTLIYDNGSIQQVSGSGKLSLPGFNNPVSFDISLSQTGANTNFRILVQDANIELSDFKVHFTEIELVSAHPDFSLTSAGSVTLPVFNGGSMGFALNVDSNNRYGFNILGTGTTVAAGPLELSDFLMNMEIENGSINNASGSGKLKVIDFTPEPVNINVSYSHDNITDIRDFRFHADANVSFDLNILELTLLIIDFHIRNGTFHAGTLSGSVSIPAFAGPPVEFLLIYAHTPPAYEVSINSTGALSAGVLTLNQIRFTFRKLANGTTQFSGTAELTFPGATAAAAVSVAYSSNRLTFTASNPPPINIGGFTLAFSSVGFAIEKNPATGNSALKDLNFAGSMTIPACEPGFNTLAFVFDMTEGGNRYSIKLNPGAPATVLKLGPVSLGLNLFDLEVENGAVKSLAGSAGLSMEGFKNESGNPVNLAVKFSYNSGNSSYSLGLDTTGGASFDIVIGGFKLKLTSLQISFTSSQLVYPFTFAGGLEIPGLKDSDNKPASLDITISVEDKDNFSVISQSSAAFSLGNLKVSQLAVTIEKDGSNLKVELSGKLTIEQQGNDAKSLDVEILIMSDGTFRIKGQADPAIKLLDIPSAVRVYLSMIELSRLNNKWGFAMGGLVQNLIVIPGMDNLLPNELNLRTLSVADKFDLDLGVKWPSGLSIDIGGDGGGDVSVPVNGKFGDAISLDALKISYGDFTAPTVPIKFMFMGASIKLGPVAATVDGLGLEVILSKRDPFDDPGNFGVVDIDLEFLPPAGLGISLDTPVFTGGGYLFYDKPKGEYAGAVELSFKGMFAISAVAVINSKMPDGLPGTSVLFIMSVEFTPGIALGFGFFISGLGGIIGIHRTIQVDKLREGVKTGSIKNILFPTNIVSNISKIISDIKDVFPVKRDQFIIGPMAAITWGVPTIMRLDLGLAIEFANPVRFGILGVLRVILPDEKVALVKIQVAFLGIIDFEKQMLSFDASLFDSKILTFGLEGDMALRLSWGEKKDFVLSVGGFHPRYNPPAHLNIPKMKRLTVKILSGNPRLTLTSYFAVTTNTVQFGAGIDFYFGVSKFKVIGEFGFDVLFQFSPFYFVADAYARLAVKLGSTTLLGISLDFSLEGPTPWRAKGTAKFTILFITCKVKFDKTWGERRDTRLDDKDVLPLLISALDEDRNWRSLNTAHGVPGVRMKALEAGDELILTPNGVIEISQKVVPLNSNIEKFGQYSPKDYTKFEIVEAHIGSDSSASKSYIYDVFAPANFIKADDKEKLKLPSFERQASGIQIRGSGADLEAGAGINREVTYEQMLEDKNFITVLPLNTNAGLGVRESAFMMTHGAIGRSAFSNRRKLMVNPAKVKVKEPEFAVVDTDSLDQVGATYIGYMQAHEALQSAGSNVQIIPVDIIK